MRNRKLTIILAVLASFALLLVLGSVIFSVQQIEVFCYTTGPNRDQQLQESANMPRGDSIFLLRDDQIKQRLEAEFHDISVAKVERIFPNRVRIHYGMLTARAFVEQDSVCFVLDQNAKIIGTRDTVPTDLIRLELGQPLVAPASGQQASGADAQVAAQVMSAFVRLGLADSMNALIQSIQLTSPQNIVINTGYGGTFVLVGRDNVLDKLHKIWTVYCSDQRYRVGTLTVTDADGTFNVTFAP